MNGLIVVVAKIIKNAVASAAEAEAGALFVNAQLAAPMQTASEEPGHPNCDVLVKYWKYVCLRTERHVESPVQA